MSVMGTLYNLNLAVVLVGTWFWVNFLCAVYGLNACVHKEEKEAYTTFANTQTNTRHETGTQTRVPLLGLDEKKNACTDRRNFLVLVGILPN